MTLEPMTDTRPSRAGDEGDGRRARTRGEIRAAANRLFVRDGYAAATMEKIAEAAGIRRSTLYTHFADKEQILAAIGADYIDDVCAVIRQLPGPTPTRPQIAAWFEDFARFVSARPGPAELIVAVGYHGDLPEPSKAFGAAMLRAFAERLVAFEHALAPDEGFRLAWALATLGQMATALIYHARHGESEPARDKLAVAAMLFENFVRDER